MLSKMPYLSRHQRYCAGPRRAAPFEFYRKRSDFKTVRARKRAQVHFVNEAEFSVSTSVVYGKKLVRFAGAKRCDHGNERAVHGFAVAADHTHSLIQEPTKGIELQADR